MIDVKPTAHQVQSALKWAGRFGHTETGWAAKILAAKIRQMEHDRLAEHDQTPPVSGVTARLIELLRSRDAIGQAKYGKSMDRSDLTTKQWLQHLKEELLDAALYVEAIQASLDASTHPLPQPAAQRQEQA